MTQIGYASAWRSIRAAALSAGLLAAAAPAQGQNADWPSYNRTLTSERFSPLDAINTGNAARLRRICEFDTGLTTSFQTGPIVVGDVLYLTSEFETVALNPADCRVLWRVRENYKAVSPLKVNRGAAYLDGRLFRGTQDGRVLAYDARTGRKLWERLLGDRSKGETIPAALIAWDGLVFAGNAGGDNKGVRGRMYALNAATGAVAWRFDLVPERPAGAGGEPAGIAARSWGNAPDVPITGGATWTSYTLDPEAGLLYVPGGNPAPDFTPQLRPGDNLFTNAVVVLDARTGAYRRHFQLVPEDYHDWDVSAAPSLFTSRAGRRLMAAAIKDGHLYLYDRDSGERRARLPVTTIENAQAPLTPEGVRFCPGTNGGVEWNGPAYSPRTNAVYTGSVDWCATVKMAADAAVKSVALGQPWSGSGDKENVFGDLDPQERWAGWVYAIDADTAAVRWRWKAPTPIVSGVTPTAGDLLFVGDLTGRVYAFDARTGGRLWSDDAGGAIGGGIITYAAGGKQRVAVAAGMTSSVWPTEKATAKLVVYGVE